MAGLGCMHYFRLITSAIGVAVGLLACLTFSVAYNHIVASAFALTSAIFAGICFTLHVLHHRNVLHVWHSPDTLDDISKLGIFVFVIGSAWTGWYIFDGLYHHRAMMPFQDSPYITAVWSFMTGKWGLLLWSCSRTYWSLLNSNLLIAD